MICRWAFLGAIALGSCASVASAEADRFRAVVTSVYDGDTMTADVELGLDVVLRDQRLRLDCVDTPEIRGPERAEGIAARDRVREWIGSGDVRIEVMGRGKYGRWLAHVTPVGWSESINSRLLREGLAVRPAYADGCM